MSDLGVEEILLHEQVHRFDCSTTLKQSDS